MHTNITDRHKEPRNDHYLLQQISSRGEGNQYAISSDSYPDTMQPVINYRQSRRSACDRCRGFKLRCEREQVNGRSCERCLKAQVECTTSAAQPTQSIFSMRKEIYPFSRSCGDLIRDGDISSALLHRPCDSRVRKSVRSSGIYHRIEQQKLNTWIDQSGFPFIAGDDTFLPSGTKDVQLNQLSYPTSSLDKWNQEPLARTDSHLHYVSNFTLQGKNGENFPKF